MDMSLYVELGDLSTQNTQMCVIGVGILLQI